MLVKPLHQPSSIFKVLFTFACIGLFIHGPLVSTPWRQSLISKWRPGLLTTESAPAADIIGELVQKAKADFEKTVARQSKTLEDATKEYQRRYHKKPPKGFDRWFSWAQENNITRIDEFDQMMEVFAPLRQVPAQTLKTLFRQAVQFGGFTTLRIENHTLSGNDDGQDGEREARHRDEIEASRYKLEESRTEMQKRQELKDVPDEGRVAGTESGPETREGEGEIEVLEEGQQEEVQQGEVEIEDEVGGYWFEESFDSLLTPILPYLPDLAILLNRNDEPVVARGNDMTEIRDARFIERAATMSPDGLDSYDVLVELPCQGYEGDPNVKDPYWPYVSDVAASKDVCTHQDIANDYPMIRTPNRLIITDAPVPVLSMSRLSVNGDLTYPSPWYISRLQRPESSSPEPPVPWQARQNDLYWTGSLRGGYFRHFDNWRRYPRPHFVGSVNGLFNTTLSRRFSAAPSHYSVRFVYIAQVEDEAYPEIVSAFAIAPSDEETEKGKHRFLFDLDGNSYTERFLGLLETGSTVLKQTLQREWWEEWTWAWVHYVPVSMSLEELPDMMEHFTSTEEGEAIAKAIAQAGREWVRTALRIEEMSSYMFRLLLEYAELFEDVLRADGESRGEQSWEPQPRSEDQFKHKS